jgi:PAS domain S-box-containing protein
MDVVRAKVDGIATIERGLLATRVAVQNQAFATAYVMTILGGAASLAVATLMGVLLTRKIAAPIARMTRVMASLAEGDTGVVVPRIERNDDIGAMAAAVEVFKDSIIERQSTQAELARREAKIRRLVDANIIGVFFYALEGGITEANDAFLDLVGYDRTDLAAGGLRWTDLTPPECFERDVQERVPELKRTGILVPFEKEYVRKDGSRVPVLIGAATLDDGGEQGVAFVLDLTGRKRAEILTAQVFDHAPDGICIVERNYRYRRANPVYARRWGMPAERIVGMHVSELLGADVFEHVLKANLDRCFAGEEVAFEWLARAQDGLYLSVSYSPLRSGAHEVEAALVIQRDLTEYMRANERLRASQADLAHVTRMSTLGELAASIVHEVNQPLAGIAASADAGLRWLERQSPDLLAARRSLARVRQEADRAVAVIGRIRALARKSPIRMDRLDINAVVQDVIALMRSELDRNRIRLRTRLAPDLPAVQGDRIHLQQVILNLMVNAIEAMQDTDHRELLISSAPGDADDLRVAIYDWGPGLDTDNCDRIFASFYTTKPHGMGMGLSISRSIIEAHGGRLTAAANKPHGAIFQFTVPLPSSAS